MQKLLRLTALTWLCVSGHAYAAEARSVAAKAVLGDHYPERRIPFPDGVVSLPDLTYSTIEGYRPLRLDVYRQSAQTGPRPLVVYVHGGGWQGGHTRQSGAFENFPGVLASLAARGYVVASIEYRLSGEAPFPAAIQDVKTAIRWLRAQAKELGIDPARALVWGGSAGGQLAALAGVSCGVAALESERVANPKADCVQGVVAWYGVFDFSTIGKAQGGTGPSTFDVTSAPGKYFGCTAAGCDKERIRAASAVHFVDASDPPMLLIHGVRDRIVPIDQSRSFYQTLRGKGVKAELMEIPDVDHSFLGATQADTRKASLEALDKTFAFIDQTIGGKP